MVERHLSLVSVVAPMLNEEGGASVFCERVRAACAGLPWELGLIETHHTLVANGLRGRVDLVAGSGAGSGYPVGFDQRAVEQDIVVAGGFRGQQGRVQAWGSGGQDGDGFVQPVVAGIAVGLEIA